MWKRKHLDTEKAREGTGQNCQRDRDPRTAQVWGGKYGIQRTIEHIIPYGAPPKRVLLYSLGRTSLHLVLVPAPPPQLLRGRNGAALVRPLRTRRGSVVTPTHHNLNTILLQ